jgi:hypothetical protein
VGEDAAPETTGVDALAVAAPSTGFVWVIEA